MTTISIPWLFLACAMSIVGLCQAEPLEFTFRNPNPQVLMRDTQIIPNPQDGKFYAVGTLFWGGPDSKGDAGFRLYVSDNLKDWKEGPWILKQSEIPAEAWYRSLFWAPEIHLIHGKWVFTYNCDGTRAYDRERFCGNHGSGISVAEQITGPYKILAKEPLAPWPTNDLTLFQDDDGKVYAFFNDGFFNMKNHPESKHSIYVAELDLEKGVLKEEPRKLLTQQGGFEDLGIEGAHVIKQQGIYYLFYSGWKDGYAVGYATAKRVTGPYVRAGESPLFGARHDGALIKGGKLLKGIDHPYREIGHNQIFKGPDGNYWTSCHAYLKDGDHQFGAMLIMDRLTFDHGTVITDAPTWTPQKVMPNAQMLERFPGLSR